MAHPDYTLTYTEDSVFYAGEVRPLKWSIARKDGGLVAVPNPANVLIRDATGTLLSTLAADIESAVPALQQVCAALWTVPGIGTYAIQLTTGLGDDSQIRSDREIVVAR